MLGIDDLMAEIILALGAALAAGMGLALFGPVLRERYGLPGGASGARGPAGRDERLAGAAKGRARPSFMPSSALRPGTRK